MDSIVSYSTCNNGSTERVDLYCYKRKVTMVYRNDSINKKHSYIRNPKNTFKASFKCGPISCVERYKNSSQIKLEYERDAQDIIWRKQYSSDGTLIEDYKR